MKILILYCEVMPYNVAAFDSLINLNIDVEIDVISWGSDKKLTPYKPKPMERVNYFQEADYDFKALKILFLLNRYKLVYVCNRREKKYLKLALFVKKYSTLVIGQSDEQLYNTLRQHVKKVFSYFLYRRYFDFMFVPGYYQYEFMRFLQFKKNEILIGAYTANTKLFNDFYVKNQTLHAKSTPQYFLYIGRLEDEKGLLLVLNALDKLKQLYSFKFIIVGNGKLLNKILEYDFVEHYPFLEQESLINLLRDISFFILPSNFEPWGVVIHEMTAAGIPVICSDACGARAAFVFDSYNGFVFENHSHESVTKVLIKAFSVSVNQLNIFKRRSNELSKSVTPDLWGETINSFIS
jgi:glycosyltransferase involved in cell wall biosynthesis